jgi:Zn-dependent protease
VASSTQNPVQFELDQLAYQAKLAGQSGDWNGARAAWVRALALVQPGSPEYKTIQTRIENVDHQLDGSASVWKKRFYKLGPIGVVLWKFKTIAFLVLAKGKLLLLGLTKMSTLFSMLLSLGLYCTVYGWKFGLGFVLSIYVHEMGHVYWLRKYGIEATAPMFIPFFGALIRLKSYPANPGEDARTGLAGPMWGLGAAVFAWGAGLLTGQPIWFAIARTGVWINLFNLIPIWQLDGGRGFRALTRQHRGIVLTTALLMWAITNESMLLLIALGSLYRMFSKDYAEEKDTGVLIQFTGLIVLLSILFMLSNGAIHL